jgi:hypothetical protein
LAYATPGYPAGSTSSREDASVGSGFDVVVVGAGIVRRRPGGPAPGGRVTIRRAARVARGCGDDSDRRLVTQGHVVEGEGGHKDRPDAGCVPQMTHPDAYVDLVEQFVSFS